MKLLLLLPYLFITYSGFAQNFCFTDDITGDIILDIFDSGVSRFKLKCKECPDNYSDAPKFARYELVNDTLITESCFDTTLYYHISNESARVISLVSSEELNGFIMLEQIEQLNDSTQITRHYRDFVHPDNLNAIDSLFYFPSTGTKEKIYHSTLQGKPSRRIITIELPNDTIWTRCWSIDTVERLYFDHKVISDTVDTFTTQTIREDTYSYGVSPFAEPNAPLQLRTSRYIRHYRYNKKWEIERILIRYESPMNTAESYEMYEIEYIVVAMR